MNSEELSDFEYETEEILAIPGRRYCGMEMIVYHTVAATRFVFARLFETAAWLLLPVPLKNWTVEPRLSSLKYEVWDWYGQIQLVPGSVFETSRCIRVEFGHNPRKVYEYENGITLVEWQALADVIGKED